MPDANEVVVEAFLWFLRPCRHACLEVRSQQLISQLPMVPVLLFNAYHMISFGRSFFQNITLNAFIRFIVVYLVQQHKIGKKHSNRLCFHFELSSSRVSGILPSYQAESECPGCIQKIKMPFLLDSCRFFFLLPDFTVAVVRETSLLAIPVI